MNRILQHLATVLLASALLLPLLGVQAGATPAIDSPREIPLQTPRGVS